MSPSFLVKILLHMEAFHHHTGIICNYLRWSLSDTELININKITYRKQAFRKAYAEVEGQY